MNKKTKYFLVTCLALTILIIPLLAVHAQGLTMEAGLEEVQGATGLSSASLPSVIGKILQVVLSFLGLIALIIIVYGGFMWMTAGGAEEKVKKAKDLMINGIIGLVIIILAYAIASFIITSIISATAE